MKISIHPELPALLQESEVLQQKLSPSQIQKFLEASIALPFEKQEDLVRKLQQEKKILSDVRKQDVQEYENRINKKVKQVKKEIEKNTELSDKKSAENLLKNL